MTHEGTARILQGDTGGEKVRRRCDVMKGLMGKEMNEEEEWSSSVQWCVAAFDLGAAFVL